MKQIDRLLKWLFGAAYCPKIAIELASSETNNPSPYEGLTLYDNDPEVLSRRFCKGEIIRHFKRQWVSPNSQQYLYMYLGEGLNTETNEVYSLYCPIVERSIVHCRPRFMFHSTVDKDKYPTATQKFRFEKADSRDCLTINNRKGFYMF